MTDPSSSEAAGRRMAGPPLGGVGTGLPVEGPSVIIVVSTAGSPPGPGSALWAIASGTRINIARRAAVARNIALFTSPPYLRMCLLLLAPRSMPHNEAWRIAKEVYSPKCVEGVFCELRVDGVLRSSAILVALATMVARRSVGE